jgi:hypothetical protein
MEDDAPETNAELRAELLEARDRVRRELEILESPSTIGGSPVNGSVVTDLQKELAEIEEALGRLS